MQEGRPVAFESKKLSDVERRWPTHEKEMWAVVHCLKLWQHYLGLEYTKVYTDNVSVRYFETQPKITPKQWRWADVLACFNVDLIHKPGRDNVVPDALSRRQELRIIFTGESSLMRKIREGYQDDEESKKTLDTLRLDKKLEHFQLERGVVWFKQNAHVGSQRQVKVGTFEGVPRWSGGGASWRETNFGRVGEDLLLAKLAGRRGAICKVMCDLPAKLELSFVKRPDC